MSTVQKLNNAVRASDRVNNMLEQKVTDLKRDIKLSSAELAKDYINGFTEYAQDIWIDKYLLKHYEMCIEELSGYKPDQYIAFHREESRLARQAQQELDLTLRGTGIRTAVINWEYDALQKIQVFHNLCKNVFTMSR
jgi:hypothetical protein